MNPKAMREALKEVVETIPRSNKDVEKLFAEKFDPANMGTVVPESKIVNLPAKNVWTYIGGGHEPPQIVNFLERQVFRLGEPTDVTDPVILAKIATNGSFRLGNVSAEEILAMEAEAQKKVDLVREEDVKIQIMADRQNR